MACNEQAFCRVGTQNIVIRISVLLQWSHFGDTCLKGLIAVLSSYDAWRLVESGLKVCLVASLGRRP